MDNIADMADENSEYSLDETDNQYDVPGQLHVWTPTTDLPTDVEHERVPENYVLIKIATPLQDETYLLPVTEFECGLYPTGIDASCIYLTDNSLDVVFPVTDSEHLIVSRALKTAQTTISLRENAALDPEDYNDSKRTVVWVAPKTDAAVVED